MDGDAVVPCTTHRRLQHLLPDTGSTPTTRAPMLWRASPVTPGRGVAAQTRSAYGFHAVICCGVEDGLAVLLERLPREYLGEQIRRVRLAWNMTDDDSTCPTELTHLE